MDSLLSISDIKEDQNVIKFNQQTPKNKRFCNKFNIFHPIFILFHFIFI